MDLILYSLVSIVLFFSLPLLIFLNRKNSLYPPGRTGWPVLGESLEFLNTGRRGVPEKFFTDRMQRFSSRIFRTSILGETTAVFCGPAGNKFLFSNENTLVTSWWPRSVHELFPSSKQTSTISEGGLKLRKIYSGFLKPTALQKHVGIMDSIAKQHLNSHWENHKQVTVFPLSKTYTFALACKILMSVEDPIQLDKFAKPFVILGRGFLSIPLDLPGTAFRNAMKAPNLIKYDLIEIIKQRKINLAEGKASPRQDVLSHMLVTCDEDGNFVNDLEIAEKILGLLVAGHDTTSSAIASIVKYLAELPHIYDEVLREQLEIRDAMSGEFLTWEDIQKMRYSWNVACEAMRLAPPLQGTFREALTEFSYNGFSIPKGWKLYWSTHSTHHDPTYFPSPEKFDPSRFDGDGPSIPYTYVPFGGGPRMCPGKEFARLEILIFLHNLVTKFKWKKVILDEQIVVDPLPMPSKGLPILLKPHVT